MATKFVQAVRVELDASGAGQASVAPSGGDWKVTLTSVSTSTAINQPTLGLYLNGVGEPNWIEGSYSGNRDTSDTPHVLSMGDQLIAVWTGGDPGAVATLRVRGWQGQPGEFAGS